MDLLSVNQISKQANGVFALENISFSQPALKKISIAGETGSGKTTLLKIIAGLVQPDSGEVLFEGKRVEGPLEKLLPGHPAIGYLSQHFELRNNYRVEEELEARRLVSEARAIHIYEVCRISHLLKRKTDQLSGGERQRIVLARLLTTSPKLLLLDEPFSNLDAIHRELMRSIADDIVEELQTTCILVSHEAADSLSWADEIMVLKDGRFVERGKPEELYYSPGSEYTAALFGEYNLVPDELAAAIAGREEGTGRRLFLRPGQLTLATGEEPGLPGVVESVRFWGCFYRAIVKTGNVLLKVQLTGPSVKPGEAVRLVSREKTAWWL